MGARVRLGDLAQRVGGRVHGDVERWISGVATLQAAEPEHLAFLTNPRYKKRAASSRAGAMLVGPGTSVEGKDLLEVAEPYVALAEILELFHPPVHLRAGVSPDARLGEGVSVGKGSHIGPFAVVGDRSRLGVRSVVGAGCVIGDDCEIGDDTTLMPRVVLYARTRVGRRCLIHSGVVLGADGFGFATSGGVHRKVPQVGGVVVEDDVEIGANAAVDRGALGDTVIGEGTKLDDLVMIAHGASLGRGCLMAAQSGIAGSTRIGSRVTFAGQSGAAGHLEIGDGAVVAAKTAVFDDVPAGRFVAGIPATDHREWKRSRAILKKLPGLRAELRAIREKIEALERGREPEE